MAQTYVCSVTRLRVRHPLVLPGFFRDSAASAIVARRTEGVVKVRLLGFPLLPWYLTLTVWESAEAMRNFVKAPAHRVAMSHMANYAARGEFATFTSETPRVGWRAGFRALKNPTGVWTPKSGGVGGAAKAPASETPAAN